MNPHFLQRSIYALACGVFLLIMQPARLVAETVHGADLRSFIGWIPMQVVPSGQQITIDMHRFYFSSPGANEWLSVQESPDGKYVAQFDPTSFELNVAVDKNATGLVEIPLKVYSRVKAEVPARGRKDLGLGVSQENVVGRPLLQSVLLIGVQPADGYTFEYRAPARSAGKVSVIGAFNGWDEKANPMAPAGDGQYELFVRLPPGSHPYKFVVDGRHVLDPDNPDEAQDGPDGVSSLARVGKTDRGVPPVVFAQSAGDRRVVFRIVPGFSRVVQISTVLQLPDGNSMAIPHKVEDDTVTVDVGDVAEGTWLRAVVADAAGNVSKAARSPVRQSGEIRWQDAIVYHVLPDRFENGDNTNDRPIDDSRLMPAANFQGGDFAGIRQKINEGYFRNLGVNVLRLGPVLRTADEALWNGREATGYIAGYDGRAPVSLDEVEERFGGDAGLFDMIAAAKSSDMRVMAELQIKQVHADHSLMDQQSGLFGGGESMKEDWLRPFDYKNPDTVKLLISHAVNFARKFQFDAFHVEHLAGVRNGFWWRYRAAVRTVVDPTRKAPFYSLGEIFTNRTGIAGFVGPNMLDGQVDLPLYRTLVDVFATMKADMAEMERSLTESEVVYGKESIMSPTLGGADLPRFMAWAAGDERQPKNADASPDMFRRLKLALTFLMSIDGAPTVFYGDEIGLGGVSAPESHGMMRWDKSLTDEERSARGHFAKVAAVRNQHPALRYGSRRSLVAEGNRYAFVRAHLGDAVLVVWNRGELQTEFSLGVSPEMPDGEYIDALSGQRIRVTGGRTNFRLAPMTSALYVAAE